MTTDDGGLRERKKARTRADLQRHALRLFSERGYADTTVDDIAAAAEVSRSTFFRYFSGKEQAILYDDVDPITAAAFDELPDGTPLLTAVRRALRTAFDRLPPEKRAQEEIRMELGRTVPELRAAVAEKFDVRTVAHQLAAGTGRDERDTDVLVFAGVLCGARLTAHEMVRQNPGSSYIDALDVVLGRLEEGLPLADTPIAAAPRSPLWAANPG